MIVLLIEDHPIYSVGLTAELTKSPLIQSVHQASNIKEARTQMDIVDYNLLILDIELPDTDGLTFLSHVRQNNPSLPILIVSMHAEYSYIAEAVRLGANGYILKDSDAEDVLNAVQKLSQGKMYYCSKVVDVLASLPHLSDKKESFQYRLSNRELEVLQLIANGQTSMQIADQLFLSVKTVEHYRSSLLLKFDVANAALLVRAAVRHGFIDA